MRDRSTSRQAWFGWLGAAPAGSVSNGGKGTSSNLQSPKPATGDCPGRAAILPRVPRNNKNAARFLGTAYASGFRT